MTTPTFNKPAAASGYFTPREHLGHLILITTVHERRKKHDELKGEIVDEVICDLVDLDGDGALQEAVILSHPGLTNRTRGLEANILGRIGTVPSTKGNPAFVLDDFDETAGDVAKATAWVTAYNAGQISQPAAAPAQAQAAPAPAAQPVQQQLPAAAPAAATGNPSDLAKQLIAAGLDDTAISQATGLDGNVIAAIRNLT
jgi:hypothetical protein